MINFDYIYEIKNIDKVNDIFTIYQNIQLDKENYSGTIQNIYKKLMSCKNEKEFLLIGNLRSPILALIY